LKKKVRKKIKGNETRKEKEKGITPSRDRVVTDYNRDDNIPLLLANTSNLQIQVYSFQRKYKDKTSKTQAPGLRDLPPSIQSNFHNIFIRHIMKLVFSSTLPWNNPSLSVYQQEFDLVYSTSPQYCLHADDAVVILVTISNYR